MTAPAVTFTDTAGLNVCAGLNDTNSTLVDVVDNVVVAAAAAAVVVVVTAKS